MARDSSSLLDWHSPVSFGMRAQREESSTQRAHRLKIEAEAKRVSDEIDKRLKEDAARRKPLAAEYRMLLLGQAGAGKTTVLKQMRLLYDLQKHQRERVFWKSIIHLNLITSLRILLQTLAATRPQQGEWQGVSSQLAHPRSILRPEGEAAFQRLQSVPIASLEQKLRKTLGAVGEEEDVDENTVQWHPAKSRIDTPRNDILLLRAGWQKKLFSLARRSLTLSDKQATIHRRHSVDAIASHLSSRSLPTSHHETDVKSDQHQRSQDVVYQDCQRMLRTLQSDVQCLWSELQCRKLRKHGRLEAADATTFFLDNYGRICDKDYQPSDEDILHARVRTVGVTEDQFRVDRHLIYRIFDVGGSQSQRAAWASFFDDAQAIIFLAPISAFNQSLAENPSVNRVQDSLNLFGQICASELLKKAALILFLNKVDLLEEKLRQGIRLSMHFRDYDGDNDFEAVWRWFRAKFREIVASKRSVAPRRPVYVHTTIATSTKQIKAILMSVNDTILRDNLRATGLVG